MQIRFDPTRRLDHQSLDLVLEGADLVHEIGRLVGGDGGSDDGAGDAAGAAERRLGGDVDVGHVLVLAEEGKVQQDGEGRGVGGEDDDLGDAAVESLGRLVGALLQLAVVGCLLDDVEDLLGEGGVGDGPGWGGVRGTGGELEGEATYRRRSFALQTCWR
jgi:hypothetical protein